MYSTLWGDGLVSGMADSISGPPWNYDLMAAGYWISLGVSLLLLIGAALTLARLIGQFRAEWVAHFWHSDHFGLGFVWNSLQAPYYLCGQSVLRFPGAVTVQRTGSCRVRLVVAAAPWRGIAVWVLLLVWTMTVYTSFWVRGGNPQTQLLKCVEWGPALMAPRQARRGDPAVQEASPP